MTLEELLAARNAENDLREKEKCDTEEREIRYYARFRETFRKWPDVVAHLDEPVPIEERIRQRRAERAARRKEADEAWARVYRSATDRGVPFEPPFWP
jgi:hypothetical protein